MYGRDRCFARHSLCLAQTPVLDSQWDCLLRNLGRWEGCFDTLDRNLILQRRQPSQLTLHLEGTAVLLELLFWPDTRLESRGPGAGEPTKRIVQSFRQIDGELGFFPLGSFSRGSLQISSWSRPYAEFGFIAGNRRHRLVLLWDGSGRFDHPVLIRERRAGSSAPDQPSLQTSHLLGAWTGQRTELVRDACPDPLQPAPCQHVIEADDLPDLQWLPDGGGFCCPDRFELDSNRGFVIESWWKPTPDSLQRMQRRYDADGRWLSATHEQLQRPT